MRSTTITLDTSTLLATIINELDDQPTTPFRYPLHLPLESRSTNGWTLLGYVMFQCRVYRFR